MALADILEALTAGGSAGLSAYAREKEFERERAEREQARQEEARYRQQMLDASLRAEEREKAAIERQRVQDIERGMSEGRLREVRDIYNPAAVRQSVAGLEQEIGGVGEAPGQTYAARLMRQQEERPKSPLASALREEEPEVALEGMGRVSEELPSRLSFLSEVPEFEATESFRERGSQQYGDTAVRPVTPEERAASERERIEEAVATNQGLLERAASGDERAISEAYARGLGEQVESMIGLLNPEAPEGPDLPAGIRTLEALRSMYPDMSEEELLQRVGFGLPAGPVEDVPELPGSTVEKIAANDALLESINESLNLIGTGAEEGVGYRMGVPLVGSLLQRGGTQAERQFRAQISNIGSNLLAARSGAAISAQEFERLAPFVPSVSDNIETIQAKLNTLNKEVSRINRSYYRAFGATPPGGVTDFDEVDSGDILSDDDIINDIYGPSSTQAPLLPRVGSSNYFDNLMAPR